MHDKVIRRYQRYLEVCLCGLIFFIPFSKAGVEVWLHLGFAGWLLKRFVFARRRFRSSGKFSDFLSAFSLPLSILNKPIYILGILSFVSAIFSVDIGLAFEGVFGKLYTYFFIFFLVIEVVTKYNPVEPKQIKINSCVLHRVLGVFIFSIVVIVIDGLYQLYSGKDFIRGFVLRGHRLGASFNNPNNFAAWIIAVLPVVSSFIFVPPNRRPRPSDVDECVKSSLRRDAASLEAGQAAPQGRGRWYHGFYPWGCIKLDVYNRTLKFAARVFFLVITGFAILLLGLTFGRGAWLGYMLSLIFVGVVSLFIRVKCIRSFSILGICLLTTVLSLAFLYAPAKKRLFTLAEGFDAAGYRRLNWQEALSIIEDYPILGTGPNTYSKIGPYYKLRKGGGIYPHNCYLHMTAELGLPGFGAFLWIIGRFFVLGIKAVKRDGNPLLLGIMAGLLAFLIHSFFNTNLYALQLVALFWFLLGLGTCLIDTQITYDLRP